MPTWRVQTLCDSNSTSPLPSKHKHVHIMHLIDALIARLCEEEKRPSFDNAKKSKNSMNSKQFEYYLILKNVTLDLVDLPHGKKAIDTKWVYKLKHRANGIVEPSKMRPVAKE